MSVTPHAAMCLNIAASAAIGERPLVMAGPFTQGVDALHPIDPKAVYIMASLLGRGEHTWHRGALLVERRYANDFVAALRARGVWVP